ncbi:MAG: hypothetical protein ABSF35_24515, partial [Polyangia bacterium]
MSRPAQAAFAVAAQRSVSGPPGLIVDDGWNLHHQVVGLIRKPFASIDGIPGDLPDALSNPPSGFAFPCTTLSRARYAPGLEIHRDGVARLSLDNTGVDFLDDRSEIRIKSPDTVVARI